MFTPEMLGELFRHMEWADARVWEAVPDRESAPDDRLRLLLVHIHVVQRAFFHVWTKTPVQQAFREPEDFTRLTDVRSWAQPYYEQVHHFVEGLDAARLREPVELPWAQQLTEYFGWPPAATTLGDTCFQVTSHSTYHRAQVNARVRELGGVPPLVDYIAWVWFGRPAADWTAQSPPAHGT